MFFVLYGKLYLFYKYSKWSVFYNAPGQYGVKFVAYMEQTIRRLTKPFPDMAALDIFLPGKLPADHLTARLTTALRHAEETEVTLYELFPFGLVYETLGWVTPQGGVPATPGEAAPGRETDFRAALPTGG